MKTEEKVHDVVREFYGEVAEKGGIVGAAPGCCAVTPRSSLGLGYTEEDLANVPDGANLGLGCGNPHAIASLRPGETVLDLGSGAGFDCLLAARQVGRTGKVIGIDMTPAMIRKARKNAAAVEALNVEFRLGEIEALPVADASVDVILSNCVINLAPDKARVYREAFRVLKAGGRLAISDVVLIAEPPRELRERVEALVGCVAGAAPVDEIERTLRDAGFADVRVTINEASRAFIRDWLPGSGAERYAAAAAIEATKA